MHTLELPVASRRPTLPRRLIRRTLRPGLRLMQQFTMGQKILACCALALLPLAGLNAWSTWQQWQTREIAKKELAGTAQLRVVQTVNEWVREHRLNARGVSVGAIEARQRLAQTRQALLAAVAQADSQWQQAPDPLLVQRWQPLRDEARAIAGLSADALPAALWDRETRLAAALDGLTLLIGERSQLLLDPEGGAYFLMDLAVQHFGPWTESVARLAEIGAAGVQQGSWIDDDLRLLGAHELQAGGQLQAIDQRLEALERTGSVTPPGWQGARKLTQQFIERSVAITHQANTPANAAEHALFGLQALRAASEFNRNVLQQLDDRLHHRMNAATRVIAGQALLCVSVGLAMAYLGWCLYLSFGRALRKLDEVVQAVSSGDLTHACTIDGDAELNAIGQELGEMSRRLSGTVAEVRSTATRLSMAGDRLSDDTTALAQRTEEQATSLAQTAAAVRQISDTVELTARHARQVTDRAAQARGIASEGRQSMREAVTVMHAIEDSAKRTSEIVGLIEDIAFQTNMLSLNASVEAAKAGESGRGFSVVAEEVRRLAQRSSKAAQEVGTLLEESARQITDGVNRVSAIDLTLGEIADGINDVAGTLQHIADHTTEQSAALNQLTTAVVGLDDITRNNAAMARATFSATRELQDHASGLSRSVKAIRLWQGSSDEARALVERAARLIEEVGLEAAFTRLHDANGDFIDRDLYLFGVSRNGVYRIQSAAPELVGQPVPPIATSDGDLLTAALWRAADAGGGWVDYQISHPRTLEVIDKASWSHRVDDDLVIGCGVYRQQGIVGADTRNSGRTLGASVIAE